MALLTFANKQKTFLKIQQGSGDGLSYEDITEGYGYYVLWSTFRPNSLCIDEELEMELIDGGMQLYREEHTCEDALPDCYKQAFQEKYSRNAVTILMSEAEQMG